MRVLEKPPTSHQESAIILKSCITPSYSCCYSADATQILQYLSNIQGNQAKVPTPAVESVINDPADRVTFAMLIIFSLGSRSIAEEPTSL